MFLKDITTKHTKRKLDQVHHPLTVEVPIETIRTRHNKNYKRWNSNVLRENSIHDSYSSTTARSSSSTLKSSGGSDDSLISSMGNISERSADMIPQECQEWKTNWDDYVYSKIEILFRKRFASVSLKMSMYGIMILL